MARRSHMPNQQGTSHHERRMEHGRTARAESHGEMHHRHAKKMDTRHIHAGGHTGMTVTLDHAGEHWPHDHDTSPRPR